MIKTEDVRHDILLIIVTALFILFLTGLGTVPGPGGAPILLPG